MHLFRFALFVLPVLVLAQRPLRLDDVARFRDVADPQMSPDGRWIAYTVSEIDAKADKRVSNIWMVSADGKETLQLTYGSDGASGPRWTPDGKSLSFTSSRPGPAKGSQIWILDRRGGEARQLTALKGRISDYAWSPDGKRLALVYRERDANEPDPDAPASERRPKPIVLSRYKFKQDVEGYLSSTQLRRIYLFDVESKKLEPLTTDTKVEESLPAWSPDGTKIAFVSNHEADWDRTPNSDVFVADAKPGSAARKLTTHPGPDGGRLAWSPDSTTIAYTQGSSPKMGAYNLNRLAVVRLDGGAPRVLTEKLDRGVTSPAFSPDGKAVFALVIDDMSEYRARVSLTDGSVENLTGRGMVISAHTQAGGSYAVLLSNDTTPPAIHVPAAAGGFQKVTSHNDALLGELQLAPSEEIRFQTKDGVAVHGLLTKPFGYTAGKKYPTLLRIHGGPNSQDAHSFQLERQWFAAHGYAVVNVNYRGSAGRGQKFSESIFADWGNNEVTDLLAAVDHVVKIGVADPERLGVGGWSYGGILTDYLIATDTRFQAATSGAGTANIAALYGVDQYIVQYDNEIGPPWKNPELYLKLGYPFFKADRIRTPTLFLCGEKDFNVPLAGSEQMYQALRSLGVPTELVIYPDSFHGITRPSFVKDRLERYVAWYDKYLKKATAAD